MVSENNNTRMDHFNWHNWHNEAWYSNTTTSRYVMSRYIILCYISRHIPFLFLMKLCFIYFVIYYSFQLILFQFILFYRRKSHGHMLMPISTSSTLSTTSPTSLFVFFVFFQSKEWNGYLGRSWQSNFDQLQL